MKGETDTLVLGARLLKWALEGGRAQKRARGSRQDTGDIPTTGVILSKLAVKKTCYSHGSGEEGKKETLLSEN